MGFECNTMRMERLLQIRSDFVHRWITRSSEAGSARSMTRSTVVTGSVTYALSPASAPLEHLLRPVAASTPMYTRITESRPRCDPGDPMPNGGSDCCGTCWFNRSLGGRRGSDNFNHEVPSHCEIRDLDIPDPGYTYCANHPYHRPSRDSIPIGRVYIHREGEREEWQPSPDTDEIRRHLINIVRLPEEHADEGYHFYTFPAQYRSY